MGVDRPLSALSGDIIAESPPPSKSRIEPIMRRAIGWRVGLLLLFMLLDVFADARKGEAVTNARVCNVVVVNADVFVIMRPSDNVREIGAIVCF